jgi:DNA invertase Pin-like site-specific DNA recombinase
MELGILRNRLKLGAEAKAKRGELKFVLPPGYIHDDEGRIIVDPDRRVQKAIEAFFDPFDRCSSVRQLALGYSQTQTPFPIRKVQRRGQTSWEVPSCTALRKLLKNPTYAGTYVYGRRRQRVQYVEGR